MIFLLDKKHFMINIIHVIISAQSYIHYNNKKACIIIKLVIIIIILYIILFEVKWYKSMQSYCQIYI